MAFGRGDVSDRAIQPCLKMAGAESDPDTEPDLHALTRSIEKIAVLRGYVWQFENTTIQ